MPTTFVKGDFLLETPLIDGARAFAFAADVSGGMDSGIAVAVRRRWPELATWWSGRCGGGKVQLGDAAKWRDGEDLVYALAIEKGGAKIKVSWLERAVHAMAADATKSGLTRISVPRLWGGVTGLDPARAKRVLQEVGDGSKVALVVFEQFIRAKEQVATEPPAPDSQPTEDLVVLAPLVPEDAPKKAKAKVKPRAKPKPKAKAKPNVRARSAAAPKKKASAKAKPKPKR